MLRFDDVKAELESLGLSVSVEAGHGFYLPICPASRLFLKYHRQPDRRFAEVFRNAWGEIPASDRFRLIRFWNEYDKALPAQESEVLQSVFPIVIPRIEVVTDLNAAGWLDGSCDPDTPSQEHHQVAHTLAAYYPRIVLFGFRRDAVDALVDTELACLVARELAHAFQHATGLITGDTSPGNATLEADAIQIAKR